MKVNLLVFAIAVFIAILLVKNIKCKKKIIIILTSISILIITLCIVALSSINARYMLQIAIDEETEHHYEDNNTTGTIDLPAHSTRVRKTTLTDAKYVTLSPYDVAIELYEKNYSAKIIEFNNKVAKLEVKNGKYLFKVIITKENKFTLVEFKMIT